MAACTSTLKERRHWKMLAAGTMAVVFLMLAFSWLRVPGPGLTENRVPTVWPAWPTTLHEAAALPSRIDAYIQDHFPPRRHFIGWLNYLRYKMGYSGLARVLAGKDGWLFFNQGHIFYHTGVARLTPDQRRKWAGDFKQRVDAAAAEGASLFLFLAPEKPSVYPEMLPDWVKATPETEVLDMMASVTPELRSRIVYPLREVLQEKARHPVFGRYDTHWNGYGGYAGYRALMTAIREVNPDVEGPLPITAFALNTTRTQSSLPHDLVGMLGFAHFINIDHPTYSTVPQHDLARTRFLTDEKDWWNAQIIKTSSSKDRTLLLVRDSFSAELVPFLKPHFKTMILAHEWDGYTRNDLIQQYKPDIVVIETIETSARRVFGGP